MTTQTQVATPDPGGYGWGMDDSARLAREVERRATREVPRAPIDSVIEKLAARDAERRGGDPRQLIAKIRDRELGDRLIEEADRALVRERLARQADILLSRLPAQYRSATFPGASFGSEAREWLEQYRARRACKRPQPGQGPVSLVILGDTGTGKTWTACAISRALLVEDLVPCMVITAAELFAELRPGAGGLDVDMLQFSTVPVLTIDDLGMERQSEWTSEQLYRLAHTRSHNGLPTIVTSNLTGDQIKARYDRRTVERLFGGARLIQIDGETRRQLPF